MTLANLLKYNFGRQAIDSSQIYSNNLNCHNKI
jgi:hypothetical protein